MGGLFFVIFITIAAIVGPMLSQYNYYTQNFNIANQSPSSAHWFGTDKFGRDQFVRILYGARISLSIAYIVSLLNLVIGILYGSISGYAGGNVDNIMMRIVDVIWSVPSMIYVILLMVILNKPGVRLKMVVCQVL